MTISIPDKPIRVAFICECGKAVSGFDGWVVQCEQCQSIYTISIMRISIPPTGSKMPSSGGSMVT